MRSALVLLLVAAVAAADAQASFASAVGFSGRSADCSVCHRPASVTPASAALEGVPATYRPGQTYLLHVAVDGGPDVLLPGRPQGGFELEVDGGRLAEGPGQEQLQRMPRDNVLTYEPAGTRQRQWTAQWTAPDEGDVTFWLAVLAANGDHDPATNRSDGGERGDATATLVRVAKAPEAATPVAARDTPWPSALLALLLAVGLSGRNPTTTTSVRTRHDSLSA